MGKIIGVLFPVAYKAFNEQNGLSFMDDVSDSYRSICKNNYFDIYFRLVQSIEEISEQWYKQFLCVTNLDMVQINADLLQVAYSPKLRGKLDDIYVRIRKTAQKECACYFVSI